MRAPQLPRLRSLALVAGGVALGLGVAVGANAVGGAGDDAGPAPLGRAAVPEGSPALLDPARLADVEGPRTRTDSPQDAVTQFLAAEQAGDPEQSFGHLADVVRLDYGSPAAWAADHPDALAPVTGYELESTSGSESSATVTTLTRYRSSLDSVSGLVPARARTSWAVVREDGGWAVDLAATTQVPLLPPDADATAAVQGWAEQLQSCEGSEPQVRALRGRADLATKLCEAPGAVRAGPVTALAQTAAAPLQTSFGADVVSWARTVAVDGPVPLSAVVAPVDDRWMVVGVLAPDGSRG